MVNTLKSKFLDLWLPIEAPEAVAEGLLNFPPRHKRLSCPLTGGV